MRAIEIILTILMCGVMAMKLGHVDGGDFLSLVFLMTLAFLYMFLIVLVNGRGLRKFISDKDIKKYSTGQIVLIILTGLFLANILVGFLFHLLHWEGGDFQYTLGLIGTAVFTGLYLLFYRNKNKKVTMHLIVRVLFWTGFTLLFNYLIV